MIVSVMSPHTRGNGNTVTSMFLGLGLASMNKKVLLTHTNPTSDAFYRYLGLEQYEDKTSTPTQLVKLLRQGAIQPEEITDYCKHIYDGLDAFTTNETNFSEEDMYAFSDYMLSLSTYDFIIYDVNNLDSNTAQMVVKNSDLIIFNLTQSIMELEEFKSQDKEYMKICKDKQIVLVCNKFDKTAGKDKDITKFLEFKTRCNTISYNPWVINACNTGRIIDLYKTIKSKGIKVIELDKDIQRLATMVSKSKIAITKKRNKLKAGQGRVGEVDAK